MHRIAIVSILILFAWAVCPLHPTAGAAEPDQAASLDTDSHLVGWWKFDDASGGTAKDSSKQGHDGALAGGLSFDENSVPGRIGKAIQLDGRDGLVQMTGYKGVTGTGPRTVCAWIKTDSSRGEIISWGTPQFGNMWFMRFIRGRVGVTPHGGYYYMENLDGKIAQPDRIGLLDLWPLETGAEQDVSVGKGFKGEVDDLRIYDRALTDDEIKALYDRKG